jgi:hypothetical protein
MKPRLGRPAGLARIGAHAARDQTTDHRGRGALGDEAGLYRRLAGNKEREVVGLAFGEFGEQAERRASL